MKRLGVIGTFVWDVIHGRQPHSVPVEEWGGITYSLSALDAALPRYWEIVPIMKIGSDLADRARQFIHGLQRIASDAALVEVPYPNNRVELRYFSDERRTEMLSGGVPGWTWLALTPLIEEARLDALYVNFLRDRKSTRLNSSHLVISYAVFCLKKKKLTVLCIITVVKIPLQMSIDRK